MGWSVPLVLLGLAVVDAMLLRKLSLAITLADKQKQK